MKLPAADEEQDRVDVPEPPVTLVVDRLHDRLTELVVEERVTVPVKPFTGDTVIVTLPTRPCVTVTLVGLAFTVKSARAVM